MYNYVRNSTGVQKITKSVEYSRQKKNSGLSVNIEETNIDKTS